MAQFLLPLYSFVLLAHFDYILRSHFAVMADSSQVTFCLRLYQRMIK